MFRLLRAAALFLGLATMAAAQDAGDVLAEYGIAVTSGAAPGYVPDEACADCHADKAESFAEMGMAKSFYSPAPDKAIEDFGHPPFYHAPSDRWYRIELRAGDYWFSRWRLAPDGTRLDLFETRIDWILGSGHHSRVYLYQTPDGAMFELPLAWYSQDGGRWAMAPGYEFADHPGVLRPVPHRCMSCHNAFPQVPEGSDRDGRPQVYPADLPQGIGCQRCHGPGARHVRAVLGGDAELTEIRAAIVNPRNLSRDRLYSICYGCHLQPSVAITPGLVFGRSVYSFRPGQDIRDYQVYLDITDAHRPQDRRFDINHHPYRLEQSACARESGGALGCLTCHDPHVKIKPEQRAAHYRAACQGCHHPGPDGLPRTTGGTPHPGLEDNPDCTVCHMPARRTQDVIEVWMTDHKITRRPPPGDLLARIEKLPPDVTGVELLPEYARVTGAEALAHRAMGALNYSGGAAQDAAAALETAIAGLERQYFEPWLPLAGARLRQRDYAGAAEAARQALRLDPGNPKARGLLANALGLAGDREGAVAELRALLADRPGIAREHHNLAVFLADMGQDDAALAEARKALDLQPTLWPSWRLIAELTAGRDPEAAITAYLAALAIHPDAPRARPGLIRLLRAEGRAEEARRHQALLPR